MGLFKRVLASGAVAGLLFVSGAALADDIEGTSTSDVPVVVSPNPPSVTPPPNDAAVDDAVVDDAAVNDAEDDVSKGDEETQECREFYSSEETILELSIDGEKPFTYTHDSSAVDPDRKYSSLETDEIDKHIAMLKEFEKEGVTYADVVGDGSGFENFLKEFGKDFDLSGISGERTVTLVHYHGDVSVEMKEGKCARVGGKESESYTFTVFFPTKGPSATYVMSVYFDDKYLEDSFAPLVEGYDPNFDRIVALNGKEMTVDAFLAEMKKAGAYMGDFPKAGEVAKGKHIVKFADMAHTYSAVTVVYPEKKPGGNGNGQTKPKPTNPISGKPGNNSNANVVRPSDMSYLQFRGNGASAITPVGASPAVTAPAPAPSASPDEGEKATPKPNPTLPETGPSPSSNASAADEGIASSPAALFALAACVGLGVVAAASVIAVRRFKRA